MTGANTSSARAPISFSPNPDQSAVSHLKLTVRQFVRHSPTAISLYAICGDIGLPITISGPPAPDFQPGDRLVVEYRKEDNPLNGHFTAIYPADMRPDPKKEKPMPDIIVAGDGLSMTSLEIAALVESRHDHVKRSIERLAARGVIQLPPLEEVKNFQSLSPNSKTTAYRFTGEQGKRDSIVVVAQLSPEFTAKLVDRWQELEKQLAGQQPAAPAIPQSLPEALRLAADLAEKNEALALERDEAVRTKALIGSKREATAMATAAAAKRIAERLSHELGRNSRHATVTAVEKMTGQKFPRNAYVAMRQWCRRQNVTPVDVVDERYGMVKAWPAGAWRDCHDIDIAALFGPPLADGSDHTTAATRH